MLYPSYLFVIPREEDTTSSMYPHPDGSPIQTQPVSGRKKVDLVCDGLRSAMEAMSVNKSVTQLSFLGKPFPNPVKCSVLTFFCTIVHQKKLNIGSLKENLCLTVGFLCIFAKLALVFSLCFASIRPQTFNPIRAVEYCFNLKMVPAGSSCPY